LNSSASAASTRAWNAASRRGLLRQQVDVQVAVARVPNDAVSRSWRAPIASTRRSISGIELGGTTVSSDSLNL
jgi:hypothetical protein